MLNKNDIIVISYLRANARKNITRMSRETNIPASTIFDKLKRFEKSFISKYTTLLDFKKLGYERAKILIKVENRDKERFVDFAKKHEMVNAAYKINSRYDFLLEIVFKKLEDYYRFLDELKEFNILMKEDYYIMEYIKIEGFLANF